MQTIFHSPRTAARPRRRNWRNPIMFLIMPKTGSRVWEIFQDFKVEEVDTNYVLAGANRKKKVTELLVMNYRPIA
jgi:hypothetical protein